MLSLPTAELVSRGMYGDTGGFLVYRAGLIKAVHGILAKLQLAAWRGRRRCVIAGDMINLSQADLTCPSISSARI